MVVRNALFLLLQISLPLFVVDLGKPAFTDGWDAILPAGSDCGDVLHNERMQCYGSTKPT